MTRDPYVRSIIMVGYLYANPFQTHMQYTLDRVLVFFFLFFFLFPFFFSLLLSYFNNLHTYVIRPRIF